MAEEQQQKQEEPVVIKKIKKTAGHGHHGGAWKVAYADFVTAMMSFFLVMWIMGLSKSAKRDIAAYFREPGPFSFLTGKALPVGIDHAKPARYIFNKNDPEFIDNFHDPTEQTTNQLPKKLLSLDSVQREKYFIALQDSAKAAEALKAKEKEFRQLLQKVAQQSPNLQKLLKHIELSITQEGLRIELIEKENNAFFEVGKATLTPEAKRILRMLAQELGKLPNHIRIEGHTDSRPFPGKNYTNWELSTDRANAARRFLEENGLWPGQVSSVIGYADRKLKNPNNPFDSSNRRISILVEYLPTSSFLETPLQ